MELIQLFKIKMKKNLHLINIYTITNNLLKKSFLVKNLLKNRNYKFKIVRAKFNKIYCNNPHRKNKKVYLNSNTGTQWQYTIDRNC